MVGSLFLIKLQGFRCFIVNITKSLRAAFFCRIPPVAATADVLFYIIFSKRRCWMYCSHTLQNYFILKPKINLIRFHSMCHSLSFALLLVAIRWHPLSLVVIHCHSLSFVVTRCTTCCHVVIRCTTLCHSLPLVVIRCHSLYDSLSLVVTRCTTGLFFFKQSYFINTFRNITFEIYVAVPLIITFVPAKILGK